MKCRSCNKKTLYPICADCAGKQEIEMIKNLYAIEESIQIARDRKKALFVLILPLNRAMIMGLLIIALGCVFSAYLTFSMWFVAIIVAGALLFLFAWIMHPPLKTEAIADYTDMTWRITQLKERKFEIIDALIVPPSEWTEYDKKLLSKNIFGTGVGN